MRTYAPKPGDVQRGVRQPGVHLLEQPGGVLLVAGPQAKVPEGVAWWPAGAHLAATLGPRYAVIGSGVGMSDENGIAPPARAP